MMNIVSLLAQNGAKYVKHTAYADIFVTYNLHDKNGKEFKCFRKEKIDSAIAYGSQIKVITIDELLNILGVTHEDIKELDRSKLAPLKDKTFASV